MTALLNSNIYNNIAITDIEYSRISKGSNTPMILNAAMRSPPYSNNTNSLVSLSTVLADNTHDGLSPLCLKSS